jgi:hypothetical protein
MRRIYSVVLLTLVASVIAISIAVENRLGILLGL